jgi:SAM-dependent methyltransferase
VDVEIPTYQLDSLRFLRVLRRNGPHRAFKSMLRHMLFDRRFFCALSRESGVDLDPFPVVDVEVMDVASADLPRDRFDMIFSFNVLEHVADVESAVRNMNAALKPNGVGLVVVHLFASLSGGHCMDWQYALDPTYPEWGIPVDVPPWDHLRDNRYPADSYLNKRRLADYQRFFHAETEVVAEERTSEGAELLSLAPRELLEEYSREDLTTALVSFTFRKKRDDGLRLSECSCSVDHCVDNA